MTKTQQVPHFFELNPSAGAEVNMPCSQQYRRRINGTELWAISIAIVIAILMIVFATQLHAQVSIIQRNFSGRTSGAEPTGLTIDRTELTH